MFKNKWKYILRGYIIGYRYRKKLKSLKKAYKNRKIRVLFYVTENQKWGYQSLYEALEKDEHFEPFVVVSLLNYVASGLDKTRYNLEENYEFFKSRGIRVEYGYKDGGYINLSKFKPDIVFYEQPWRLPRMHKPHIVSKYALTCYCDYGLDIFAPYDTYKLNFHYALWKFFICDKRLVDKYNKQKGVNIKNCETCGYLKLDEYFNKEKISIEKLWKNPEKIKIIYAPHHSFEADGIRAATFKENGKLILELAKAHPETTWIFKPHPRLRFACLTNGIMNEKELDDYFKTWAEIAGVYTQGDYFDIFKTSDLMITDCVSFLGEYLPTGKPLIRLVNKDCMELNALGEEITQAYYQVYNNNEFIEIFEQLLSGKDDKAGLREKFSGILIDSKQKTADKILQSIINKITE